MCLHRATLVEAELITNFIEDHTVFLLHNIRNYFSLLQFQNGNSTTVLPLNFTALYCSFVHEGFLLPKLQASRSNSLKLIFCDNISGWGKAFGVGIATMQTKTSRSHFGGRPLITSFRFTNRLNVLKRSNNSKYVWLLYTKS